MQRSQQHNNHSAFFKPVLFLLLFCFTTLAAMSQDKNPTDTAKAKADSLRADSIKKASPPRTGIKPYEEVVTKAYTSHVGLFSIHECKDTIYFEIPNKLLSRDIEVINRLVKGPGGTGIYSGEELDEHTIEFEKHLADSTIRIRYNFVISQADSGSAIFKAVDKSNLNPIVISFPIKAYGKDSSSYVIDVSRFLKDKNFVNSIDPNRVKAIDAGGLKDFYIESIHAYPINVEISISKNTISKVPGMPPGTPATLETHTSFIELPEHPMQQRVFDPRVGFFADQVYEFADRQQKVEDRRFILRWRLEPREEDISRWKRGELVEPKKPIVIYIDPATPRQWRPYLIQGINDWQKAFEQAGFKHAIIGKEWPENDTTMHMDDARYNVLNYLPSEIANAYGPQVHDPRSGEIIQTHIGWYHNVMQLLHDWYMIQAAAVDPKARHAKFDDELMGELIRFVSSHEIGHTLGLRHNFGSSSQTPVDSLRSRTYLAKHGHTASIMDYARFNYVAQPEDHITENELFPHIGEYDRWAIEWGYKNSNAATTEEDKKITRQWIVDNTSKNPRLWFGDGETEKLDPRCQTEDLGDDAAKANTYGIRNLQRILPNLPEWSYEEGGIYENLREAYSALKDQYGRYINHVFKNIAGVWHTPQSEDQKGEVYAPVPVALQREAVEFMNVELFTTPYWLLNKDVLAKVNEPAQPNFVEDLQIKTLNSLLDIKEMNKLLGNMRQFGEKAYPVDEYLATIHKNIWKELGSTKAIDPYRRNLQKSYVGALADILTSNDAAVTETDAYSLVRSDFKKLVTELESAIPQMNDGLSKAHLEDLENRVKNTLEAKKTM